MILENKTEIDEVGKKLELGEARITGIIKRGPAQDYYSIADYYEEDYHFVYVHHRPDWLETYGTWSNPSTCHWRF